MIKYIKYRKLILALFVVLIAWSFYNLGSFKAAYDFDEFLPQQDPVFSNTQLFYNEIGNTNKLLFIGLPLNKSIYHSDEISVLKKLEKKLKFLDKVEDTWSIVSIHDAIKGPFGWIKKPFLKVGKQDYAADSLKITKDRRIQDLFLSIDGKHVVLILKVVSGLKDDQKSKLIGDITRIADSEGYMDIKMKGKMYTEVEYIKILESENAKMMPLFLLMILISIFLFFRSWRAISFTVTCLLTSLILLYGYAAALGRTLNMATLMYPTIIVVVGSSDLIHFYSRFISLRNRYGIIRSLILTFGDMKRVLFLTTFTTAIGFISIGLSTIPQVSQFGFDAAIGLLILYVVTMVLGPIFIFYFPPSSSTSQMVKWDVFFSGLYEFITRNRKAVFISFILLCSSAIPGVFLINQNNHILGNISDEFKVHRDFSYFDNQLKQGRIINFLIEPKSDSSIYQLNLLSELNEFESYLLSHPQINSVYSSLTSIKSVQKSIKGGNWEEYKLPISDDELAKNLQLIDRFNLGSFFDRNPKFGYITISTIDNGRLSNDTLLAKISAWRKLNQADSQLQYLPSGNDLLIDLNNKYLTREMIQSLSLAMLVISILILLLFKRIKILIVCLIVNLIPLLVILGLMGYANISLNGSSAMIFTIAFVIAVDDTIHFMSRLRVEQLYGGEQIIKRSFMNTARPMFITSITLVSGYLVTLFSSVKEANYQGVLIGSTLILALFSDLILLPLLLQTINRQK